MNMFKSKLYHSRVDITLDNFDEQNDGTKLDNTTLEILHKVHAESAFRPQKAKLFGMKFVDGEEKPF